ncbi:MAG: RNA polymerase-associated protein RapA, partial [Gammaproteobacteria bacterium]|nr:RNA polymerase-associated protein RapA [Gammaproteobacteria bacterium]
MTQFIPGQRWICETELDKGLGTVLKTDVRTVTIAFLASGETRTYSQQSAPLRRALFTQGDTIESHEGWKLRIESLRENQGIITYIGKNTEGKACELAEGELSNFIQLDRPSDRMLSGQADENKWFNLRLESLKHQKQLANSSLTGLYDCRTSLIPHQLYIANEVSRRFAPRVLLADEVGLGKTIEACMIMQQQLITGRANRVLIVVPEPLVHQWLVELLRRFNLSFSIFDEERCIAIEESQDTNPFEAAQLILCDLPFLVQHPERLSQALETNWDLVIVDEAHHLDWSATEVSKEYASVEALSARSKGLILLTATPEQLGKAGHFARLRLLDPERFHSLQKFVEEEHHYQQIAEVIDAILDNEKLENKKIDLLNSWLRDSEENSFLEKISDTLCKENPLSDEDKNKIIRMLLDRHGTGRILFRNTR